jgi:recombination protein RecA
MVDPKNLDKALERIKKTYGEVHRMGNYYPRILRIPTGSFALDQASGGGFPIGRWTRLWGVTGGGKTLSAFNSIRNAQNISKLGGDYAERFPNNMVCAYYDVEGQFNKEYMEKRGIDMDALHVLEGTTIEQIVTEMETLFGSIHLHVIDSTSAANARRRLEADVEQEHRGLEAKIWGESFNHAKEYFDTTENAVIYISQARVHQGGYSPSGEVLYPPGGKNLEHASDLTINFKKGKWLYINDKGVLQETAPYAGKPADGIEIKARVDKSRVCKPFRDAVMRLNFNTAEFDTTWELVQQMKNPEYNLIDETKGSWYTVNGEKVHGENGLRTLVDESEELRNRIIDAMNIGDN